MNINLNITLPIGSSAPVSPRKMISPQGLGKWKVRYTGESIDMLPPPPMRKKLDLEGLLDVNLIYRIKRTDGKRYVGSVIATEQNNVISRFNTYNYQVNQGGGKKSMHIVNAIAKEPTSFDVKILKTCEDLSEEEVHMEEENLQDQYQTRGPDGFNHSRPTLERKRSGKRAPKDPTKTLNVPMKRSSPPRVKLESRKAATLAQTLIKQQLKGV